MEPVIINQTLLIAIAAISIWSLPWKGLALWRAARLEKKWWFLTLLVVNTAGILDIIYYFVISKKDKKEDEIEVIKKDA